MIWLVAIGAHAAEPTVRTIEHHDAKYTVVTVELGAEADVRLYGGRKGGLYLADAVEAAEAEGRRVLAATNAGMYAPDYGPVGLFVAGGEARHPIAVRDGTGNFHLKPNGVFYVDASGAHVVTTEAWTAAPPDATWATQSGPMLVIDGAIHPAFRPESTNFLLRNGVGVSDASTVHLVISETGVRFHDMATLLRDVLGCEDALYLDGTVSMLWTGEGDLPGGHFSGILAVTAPSEGEQRRLDPQPRPERGQ